MCRLGFDTFDIVLLVNVSDIYIKISNHNCALKSKIFQITDTQISSILRI